MSKVLALVLGLALGFAQSALAASITILNAATGTSATPPIKACPINSGTPTDRPFMSQSFQLLETGTGAISATVQIQASNDNGTTWTNYGSAVALSGTTTTNSSAYGSAPFDCFGAIVTAITGTSAAVTVKMDVGP